MPQTLAPGVASKTSACASSLNVVANQVQTFSSATVQPVEPSPRATSATASIIVRRLLSCPPSRRGTSSPKSSASSRARMTSGVTRRSSDAWVACSRMSGTSAVARATTAASGDDAPSGACVATADTATSIRSFGTAGRTLDAVTPAAPAAQRRIPAAKRSAPAPARASAGRLAARTMGSLSLDGAGMGLRPFADAEVQRTDDLDVFRDRLNGAFYPAAWSTAGAMPGAPCAS